MIYGPTHETGPTTPVLSAAIAGGPSRLLCRLPIHGDGLASLSVAHDQSEVVWSRLESAEDIWVIEDFR